jgi:ribosomal protein S27E
MKEQRHAPDQIKTRETKTIEVIIGRKIEGIPPSGWRKGSITTNPSEVEGRSAHDMVFMRCPICGNIYYVRDDASTWYQCPNCSAPIC